jgi:AcrR family transcriptional regulator
MTTPTEHLDPRVIRTRKLLRDALIELIPERGYDAITVKDITDRATLNRATFYLHYRDKEDLLDRGFEEIWHELTRGNPFPHAPGGRLSLDATHETVRTDFEHLARHAAFYRVMIGRDGVGHFIHRMQQHVYATTAERLAGLPVHRSPTDPPLDVVLQFIASAYVGLMQWWLEHDMPSSPDEMAGTIVKLYDVSPFEAMGLRTGGATG